MATGWNFHLPPYVGHSGGVQYVDSVYRALCEALGLRTVPVAAGDAVADAQEVTLAEAQPLPVAEPSAEAVGGLDGVAQPEAGAVLGDFDALCASRSNAPVCRLQTCGVKAILGCQTVFRGP